MLYAENLSIEISSNTNGQLISDIDESTLTVIFSFRLHFSIHIMNKWIAKNYAPYISPA